MQESTSYIQLLGPSGTTGSQGYIYLSNDSFNPPSLTFAAADLRDISKRNSTYSNDFIVPGNKNNNKIFGNAFDIDAEDYSFNMNKKQRCIVWTNGEPVLTGAYIRLLDVNSKTLKTPTGVEEHITYTVNVFDNRTDFYDSISEAFLDDIDLSQWNHTLSPTNIFASSANTFSDVYKYHLNYKNSGLYHTEDFNPDVFLRTYWDKMHDLHGYSYEGFPDTYDVFKKLLIPYNGDTPTIPQADLDLRKFQASISASTAYNQIRTAGSTDYATDNLSSLSTVLQLGDPLANQYIITVPYNDDASGTNYDSGNTFNVATNTWTVDEPGIYDINVSFKARFTFSSSTIGYCQADGLPVPSQSPETDIKHRAFVIKNLSAAVPLTFSNIASFLSNNVMGGVDGIEPVRMPRRDTGTITGPDILANTQYQTDVTYDFSIDGELLDSGDEITVIVLFDNQPNKYYDTGNLAEWQAGIILGNPGPFASHIIPSTFRFEFLTTQGSFNRLTNPPHQSNMQEGQTVRLNRYIPKKVKQSDLYSSIVTLFNLYIEQDKDDETHFIIQTRDDYYSGDTFDNWTEEFVTEIESNMKFLSELQNKRLNFTYKEDKDTYNTEYKVSTDFVYGQKYIVFDNEYLIGEKKIEPIFSPTPNVYNQYLGTVVPYIDSRAPKNNIRLLYDAGMKDGNFKFQSSASTVINTRTSYPFASHLDDPTAPTLDLNWAENSYMFVNMQTMTNNNLYNNYWETYISQIVTGKMFTGWFRLTEKHISNLDLSKKIFIENKGYFYINKIIDFNVVNPGLTKVELFKIDEGLKTLPNNAGVIGDKPTGEQDTPPVGPAVPDSGYPRPPIQSSSGNKANTRNMGMIGGTGNTMSSNTEKYMVMSDGNIVDGKNVTIFGGKDNVVAFGAKNVTLIGSTNKVVTEDGTVFIKNTQFKNGTIIPGYNDWDAGLDEVISPFRTSPENDVDSGVDEVRGIDGNSPIQDFDSGEDNTNA